MENIKTFGDLIMNYSLIIPDYQRAYSWEKEQLIPFMNDILEHCNDSSNHSKKTAYYLGHFILENPIDKPNFNFFEIIDGQQRISTVFLFLLVCGFLKNKDYINNFDFTPVEYDLEGFNNLKSILENKINVDSKLENLMLTSKTSSLKRMIEAVILFKNSFSDSGSLKNEVALNVDDIEKYIEIIFNAYCSVATYEDKAFALQIFELHNTRGINQAVTGK